MWSQAPATACRGITSGSPRRLPRKPEALHPPLFWGNKGSQVAERGLCSLALRPVRPWQSGVHCQDETSLLTAFRGIHTARATKAGLTGTRESMRPTPLSFSSPTLGGRQTASPPYLTDTRLACVEFTPLVLSRVLGSLFNSGLIPY